MSHCFRDFSTIVICKSLLLINTIKAKHQGLLTLFVINEFAVIVLAITAFYCISHKSDRFYYFRLDEIPIRNPSSSYRNGTLLPVQNHRASVNGRLHSAGGRRGRLFHRWPRPSHERGLKIQAVQSPPQTGREIRWRSFELFSLRCWSDPTHFARNLHY